MNMDNPIDTLAESLYHCKYNVFSLKTYKKFDIKKHSETGERKYYESVTPTTTNDLEVVGMFIQLWGSTALGFDGIGGAAMTEAYTTIIKFERKYAVYFGGKFAYGVENPNQLFFDDMKTNNMKPVKECKKYE